MAEILVTGGCGFIGREAVKQLTADGHGVRVLDNLAYAAAPVAEGAAVMIEGSVGDRDVLRRALEGVEGCVHLAGSPVLGNPRSDMTHDAEPFLAAADVLFSEATRAGVPVVYASSAAVYGAGQSARIAESDPTVPVNAHGAEKRALELTAERYAARDGTPSIGLRMFNVYGPGQFPRSPYCGVVRLFAEKIITGAEAVIRGEGAQVRDFVYVSDAARAIGLALAVPLDGARVVNICTGQPVTILDIITRLEGATGKTLRRRQEPDPGTAVAVSVGDPALAKDLLGFTAEISFDDGVVRMMRALAQGSA